MKENICKKIERKVKVDCSHEEDVIEKKLEKQKELTYR